MGFFMKKKGSEAGSERWNAIEGELVKYSFGSLFLFFKFIKSCEENLLAAAFSHECKALREKLFSRLFLRSCTQKIRLLDNFYYSVFEFKGEMYFSKTSEDCFEIFPFDSSLSQENNENREFLIFMVENNHFITVTEQDLLQGYSGYEELLLDILFLPEA
jgi:hypothetical protein